MQSLSGKVVWITGASSGIGASLAEQASQAGATLILSGRNAARLEESAARCRGSVQLLPFDLEDSAHLEEIASRAWALHGRVDVLVHSAGIAHRDLAERTRMPVVRSVMEVDFFGPVALTTALLPVMLRRGSGHLVVISSLSGKYGVPQASAYSGCKHALHGWFDSLRAEIQGRGLRVTLVVPSFVDTDICPRALRGDGSHYGRQMRVHQKGMSPARCAAAILRAMLTQPEEIVVGLDGQVSVLVDRVAPGVWRWAMRHHPIHAWRSATRLLHVAGADVAEGRTA
jgi:dehydrogenase/reductase SDR family protein 7B